MAGSYVSVDVCFLVCRAGGCGQETRAQTRYLELLLADLEHNFGGNDAYRYPQGHASWRLPGACLCFPVSSSVQEADVAAVQPPKHNGVDSVERQE